MWFLVGVLVFAVGVALSIALHEVGHLLPAKRFGVKVTQYMVGFGPTVWSRHRGETEYGLKAIPLGGYIRMIGMFPPKPGQDPRLLRPSSTGRMGLLVEQARQQSMDEIDEGDEHRVFYKLSVPKKLVVMLGGPTMNLVIASILLGVIVSGFGVSAPTTTIDSVQKCMLSASAPLNAVCKPTDPATPAAAAGLEAGDRVVEFAGRKVTSWDQVRAAIRVHGGQPVALTVLRAGRDVSLTVTPVLTQRQVVDANGNPVTTAGGKPKLETVGFLGLEPTQSLQTKPVTAVPGIVGSYLGKTAGLIVALPVRMVGVVKAAFGSGARDPNGPVGLIGVGRLAGDIGSAHPVGVVVHWQDRVQGWLGILASLNLALFVFNLVPLLPLDGGHVAGALFEGVRRQVARVRRRRDPGPADVARLLPVAYAVSSILLVMFVLLAYADIVKPIKLGG